MSSQSRTNSPRSGSQRAGVGFEIRLGEVGRRRVRKCEERRPAVVAVAGPPADRDLLRVSPVSHDEVVRRRVRRLAVEEVDRHVERSPPGIHRCHAAPERSPELREHQGGLGRRREVGRHPVGVIGRVLAILVQRRGPWHLLWLRVYLDLAGQAAHGLQDLAGHLGHWSVRHQRNADLASIGVLHERLVGAEVQPGDDRAGTVRRREDVGLPPAGREPERSMLQLRLGRCQLDGQLAQDLGVGVERVAGVGPGLVGERGPGGRHD